MDAIRSETAPRKDAPRYSAAEVRDAYAMVFRAPTGRIVLWDLMRRFGFDEQTGIERANAALSGMGEGQKEVVRHVLAASGFSIFGITVDASTNKPKGETKNGIQTET
jgi:hypothetical protein